MGNLLSSDPHPLRLETYSTMGLRRGWGRRPSWGRETLEAGTAGSGSQRGPTGNLPQSLLLHRGPFPSCSWWRRGPGTCSQEEASSGGGLACLSMLPPPQRHYEQYHGFVVIHGTDTMAFAASVLSFVLENLQKTVILTGAQVASPRAFLRPQGQSTLLGPGSPGFLHSSAVPEAGPALPVPSSWHRSAPRALSSASPATLVGGVESMARCLP